jgi:tetratricopeptide (TPR) repeat protein
VGVRESLLGTAALFLGNCRALLGDAEGAIAAYKEAIEATRRRSGLQFVEALVNHGVILIEEGAAAEAMELLERGEKACRARVRLPISGRSSNDWAEVFGCSYLHHNLGVAEVLLDDPAGGRERFESALEITKAAIELAPADQNEELQALQAFNHQKLAWAAAKEHQRRRTAGEEAEAGDGLLATAAESLETAVTLWNEHQDAPLPQAFGITEARLDVANERWAKAWPKLEKLVEEGAGDGAPEVFLLLAITQVCSGTPEVSLQTLALYVISAKDHTVGSEHYSYWGNRCKNSE